MLLDSAFDLLGDRHGHVSSLSGFASALSLGLALPQRRQPLLLLKAEAHGDEGDPVVELVEKLLEDGVWTDVLDGSVGKQRPEHFQRGLEPFSNGLLEGSRCFAKALVEHVRMSLALLEHQAGELHGVVVPEFGLLAFDVVVVDGSW